MHTCIFVLRSHGIGKSGAASSYNPHVGAAQGLNAGALHGFEKNPRSKHRPTYVLQCCSQSWFSMAFESHVLAPNQTNFWGAHTILSDCLPWGVFPQRSCFEPFPPRPSISLPRLPLPRPQASSHADETGNTLQYADRAKAIVTKACMVLGLRCRAGVPPPACRRHQPEPEPLHQ